MKFSIQEEGHPGEPSPDKQIFFTFKEASAQTGLPSKVILRVLQSGQQKYVRRADKKVFWIREEEQSPFIQVDGKNFFHRGRNPRDLWTFSHSFLQSTPEEKNSFSGFSGEIA